MKEKMKHFLRGVVSAFTLYPDTSARMRERFLQRSDAEALYGDWQRVGNDINTAIRKYESENNLPE